MKTKRLLLLFLLAFVVRVGLFAALAVGSGTALSDFSLLPQDAPEYYDLSTNILSGEGFTLGEAASFEPESFRLPVYPAFLACLRAFNIPIIGIILIQIVLSSLSVLLLYLLAKKFFSERVALIASVAFALEPTSAFYTSIFLSDTLFVFLLLLGCFLFFYRFETRWKDLLSGAAAGIVLGLMVLTRVIGEFLPLIFIAFGLFVIYKQRVRGEMYKYIFRVLLCLICFALVLVPWSLRSHKLFNTYSLSSTSDINFVRYVVPMFYARTHGISTGEGYAYVENKLVLPMGSFEGRSLRYHREFQQIIKEEIGGHILSYVPFHLFKSLPFFLNDGLRNIRYVLDPTHEAERSVNFTDLILQRKFGDIAVHILRPDLGTILFTTGLTVWIIIDLLCLWGLIAGLRKMDLGVIFFALLVLYFAILTGPVFEARYRMPAAPFMLLLASVGSAALYDIILEWKNRKQLSL